MEIEWIITGLTSIIIFIAAFIHAIAGFGYSQVVMGLLPLVRNPGSSSIVSTITAIGTNTRVFWSVRDHFSLKDWGVPVSGLVFGLPLGIYVFKGLNDTLMRLTIGVVLIVSVFFIVSIQKLSLVDQWLQEKNVTSGWKTGFIAGFIAGILGGAVAIPGPPMILYGAVMISLGVWSGEKMKAVLTAFFGTLMVYRFTALLVTADVTVSLITEAVIAVPALLMGAWVGIKIFNAIPQKIFSWVVLGGLTINAVILIVTAL